MGYSVLPLSLSWSVTSTATMVVYASQTGPAMGLGSMF